MKYTKREITLLIILLTLITAGGFNKFVLKKQAGKISELKSKELTLQSQVKNIKNEIGTQQRLLSDLKIYKAKAADKSSIFFPSINQEKFIVLMDSIISHSGIKVDSVDFSKGVTAEILPPSSDKNGNKANNASSASVGNSANTAANTESKMDNPLNSLVNEYNGVKAAGTSNGKGAKNINMADNMELKLNFNGKYSDFISFLNNIEAFSKKIIIKSLTMSSSDADTISGTITLDFYAIPKFNPEDENYIPWNFTDQYGKINPFNSDSSGVISSNVINQYDFIMNVRAVNNDLPTVALGKSDDAAKNTYIYGDNLGIENINILFLQQDGKYYYKYKTDEEAYPLNFSSAGLQFVPASKAINIKISSSKRTSSKDVSGVNVKISNKTDLAVNVSVEGDDEALPRVKVSGEGNISVR